MGLNKAHFNKDAVARVKLLKYLHRNKNPWTESDTGKLISLRDDLFSRLNAVGGDLTKLGLTFKELSTDQILVTFPGQTIGDSNMHRCTPLQNLS